VSLEQLQEWATWLWQELWQPAPYTRAPWAAVVGLLLGLLALGAGLVLVGVPRFRRWWYDETPRPNEDERGVSTIEMTLVEHLLELRNRLVKAAVALAAATILAAIFYQRWFDIAVWPIMGRCKPAAAAALSAAAPEAAGAAGAAGGVQLPCLQAITPTELVFAFIKVTLVVGLILAMPVIAYQAWAYIAPGLTRKERRYVIALVPGVTISFVAGILFAYFALMPPALGFLLGFGNNVVEIKPTVASYISFITRLLVAIGLVFQLPVVLFFLAKVRLINPKMLGTIRRYVVVVAFIVAAVVTPTPDPFNQLLVAIPILVLYEVGALLARFA
jgi:sec-independent protein translocase protein TatC